MAEGTNDKDQAHLRAGYVPLKEYIDARFDATAKAVDKAEATLAARLAGMNEFRDQLKDQAARFITRDEVALMIKPLCDDMRECRDFMAQHQGKASQTALLITAALSVLGLLVGALALFLEWKKGAP